MASTVKTIFHVDMDAFFVSVEELFDPTLQGKAVVVGGQRDERGVVSAASYEARRYGVHSAMPLRTAAKMCPHAIFVNGHPDRYRECSQRVHQVLTTYSPQVEMASIDEAYIDMTGTERLHGRPLRAAQSLHDKMKAETGLNCSIGIGISRLIAKVSSAKAKPNGAKATKFDNIDSPELPQSVSDRLDAVASKNKDCTANGFDFNNND